MCEDMGVDTGIDLDALIGCAALARDIVGRDLPSALLHAGPRTRKHEA
jgi:hydroxymethylglutaryl-CoA lyase